MISRSITITEFRQSPSKYLDRILSRNESFVLYRNGKAVAQLRPVAKGLRLGDVPRVIRGLPKLSQRELAEFAADLQSARTPSTTGE